MERGTRSPAISFALGWELWSLVVAVLVRLVGDMWLLAVSYREFFRSLRQVVEPGNLSWRNEILPLQWRMGLRGVRRRWRGPVSVQIGSRA